MNPSDRHPHLIEGGRYVDQRGSVSYVNAFDFKGVDRFYWIEADAAKDPRGWIGHRRDHKWFSVIRGAVLIAVVRPDVWESPNRNLPVQGFSLAAEKPQVLYVPPSYATRSLNLYGEAILMVFSSGKIEEAPTDNFRFPSDYWPICELSPHSEA